MQSTTNTSANERAREHDEPAYPPLDSVTRPTAETAAAAYYLNRRPQTLRGWACAEDGPLRPVRINGRLAWPIAEIRRLLGVVTAQR